MIYSFDLMAFRFIIISVASRPKSTTITGSYIMKWQSALLFVVASLCFASSNLWADMVPIPVTSNVILGSIGLTFSGYSKEKESYKMANEHEIDKSMASLPEQGTDTQSQKPRHKWLSQIIPWIALSIALFGGIPGILTLKTFLNKTSIKTTFDRENSRFVPILSQNNQMAGKTALILLRILIVGTGERDARIANLTTSVCYKGKWIPGVRMHPKVHETPDSEGISKKHIIVMFKEDADTSASLRMAWYEFEPGQYILGYGEPTAFSFACYYDIPGEDLNAITKLRIRIYDYLGNCYKTDVGTANMMFTKLKEAVLLAD